MSLALRMAAAMAGGGSSAIKRSVLFDGVGDCLTFSAITLSGDFTAETWIYKTAVDATGFSQIFSYNGGVTRLRIDDPTAGSMATSFGSSDIIAATGTLVTLNTWHHIAWTRQGSTVRQFCDGALNGSGTSSAALVIDAIAGYNGFDVAEVNGYLSNTRIVSGPALYTSAFTPPTSPLTAVAGTVMLTCNNTTIIDGSSSPRTITLRGTPTVNTLSPF